MSTRIYDHCRCGHNRVSHDDFEGDCKKCGCDVFHRGMLRHSVIVE
jgi:hypothetical protein